MVRATSTQSRCRFIPSVTNSMPCSSRTHSTFQGYRAVGERFLPPADQVQPANCVWSFSNGSFLKIQTLSIIYWSSIMNQSIKNMRDPKTKWTFSHSNIMIYKRFGACARKGVAVASVKMVIFFLTRKVFTIFEKNSNTKKRLEVWATIFYITVVPHLDILIHPQREREKEQLWANMFLFFIFIFIFLKRQRLLDRLLGWAPTKKVESICGIELL